MHDSSAKQTAWDTLQPLRTWADQATVAQQPCPPTDWLMVPGSWKRTPLCTPCLLLKATFMNSVMARGASCLLAQPTWEAHPA